MLKRYSTCCIIIFTIIFIISGCANSRYICVVGLTNDGSGEGTISSESTPTGLYDEGAAILVLTVAGEGYSLFGWFDAETNGELISTDNPYEFPLTGDTYLYAQFGLPPGGDSKVPEVNVDNIVSGRIHTGFIVGTASDDTSVASVEVKLDGGAWNTASGTSSWFFALPAGNAAWREGTDHTISVRSVDTSGNASAEAGLSVQIGNNMDINGDGYIDIAVGASGYDSARGRTYVFFGGVSDQNAGTADAVFTGEATGNWFGDRLRLGDLNGDGYADFAVSAIGYNSNTGRVYVFYGGSDFTGGDASSADTIITGTAAVDSTNLGFSLEIADVNNDGYADLLAGEPGYSYYHGRVHIFMGGASAIANCDLSTGGTTDVIITTSGYETSFGWGIECADFNGDGYQDIAVASLYDSYIFHGSISGFTDVDSSAANTVFTGVTGLKACGDLNGDGYSDLLIQDGFVLYGLYGGTDGISDVDLSVSGGDIEITGIDSGGSVDVGDVNGDGYIDIAVGCKMLNTAWVFEGGASGFTNRDAAAANTTVTGGAGDELGEGVLLKDLDSDGCAELIVGAGAYNSDQGCVYIQRGATGGITSRDYSSDTPSAVIIGEGGVLGTRLGK